MKRYEFKRDYMAHCWCEMEEDKDGEYIKVEELLSNMQQALDDHKRNNPKSNKDPYAKAHFSGALGMFKLVKYLLK